MRLVLPCPLYKSGQKIFVEEEPALETRSWDSEALIIHGACHLLYSDGEKKGEWGTLWHRLLGASAYPVSILPSFCTSTAYLTLEANRLCWKYSLPYTAYDQFLWGRSKHLCIDFAFCKTYCFSEKQRTSAGTDVFPFLFSFFLSGMELSPGRGRAAYCAFITGHSMLRMAGKKDRESLVPF